MPRVRIRDPGATAEDGPVRVLETESSRMTRYDASNIHELSDARMAELAQLYMGAYRRSIWGSVPEKDPEEAARLKEWYGSGDGKAWLEKYGRINPYVLNPRRGVVLNSHETAELQEWYDTAEGVGWFRDALKFYTDQVKEGKCQMIVAEDKGTGRIIGSSFIMTAKAFLDNAETEKAQEFREILKSTGASVEKSLYWGELFVAQEVRGARGGIVVAAQLEQILDFAVSKGYTALYAWTLDRPDNAMLDIGQKFGLVPVPGGQVEKGADIGVRENGTLGYVSGTDGPAIYLRANIEVASLSMALLGARK